MTCDIITMTIIHFKIVSSLVNDVQDFNKYLDFINKNAKRKKRNVPISPNVPNNVGRRLLPRTLAYPIPSPYVV